MVLASVGDLESEGQNSLKQWVRCRFQWVGLIYGRCVFHPTDTNGLLFESAA